MGKYKTCKTCGRSTNKTYSGECLNCLNKDLTPHQRVQYVGLRASGKTHGEARSIWK